MKMKKRISTILAVVLTIALLASSFAMLGVSAEEPALEQVKETITVGGNTYDINANEKYSAVTEYNKVVSGLVHNNSVDLSSSAWKFAFKQFADQGYGKKIDGTDFSLIYRNASKSDTSTTELSKLGIQVSNGTYSHYYHASSVSYFSGKDSLLVAPFQRGGQPADADQRIKLSYFAKRDGKVVLWDNKGTINIAANQWSQYDLQYDPYYMWTGTTLTNGTKIEVYIWKNEELLWPLNGEDNFVSGSNAAFNFPDLGEIEVAEGDEIYIEFVQNTHAIRAGVLCAPMVAYAYEAPPAATETITVNGKEYAAYSDGIFDAAKEVTALVNKSTLNTDVTFEGAWKFQFKYSNGNFATASKYRNTYETSGANAVTTGIQNGSNSNFVWNRAAVGVREENQSLWVSPYNSFNDSAAKMIFTADRDGKIVLWDKNNAIKGGGNIFNVTGFWGWQNSYAGEVNISIYKNDTKLWPLNGEVNTMTLSSPTLTFPDLGEIEVKAGDEIYILAETNNTGRAPIACAPMAAYIHEEPQAIETITANGKEYAAYSNGIFSAYDEFTTLMANSTLGATNLTYTGGWKPQFKQGNLNFGTAAYYVNTYGSDLPGIQNGSPGYARTALSRFNDNYLWVSPNHQSVAGTARLVFTADRDGEVLLWDRNNKVTIVTDQWGNVYGLQNGPYWMWETSKDTEISVSIWKKSGDNDAVQIWPTADEANVISLSTKTVVFPELDPIAVATGDEIYIQFDQSTVNTRAAVLCNPMIAYVHEHNFETDTVEGGRYYNPTVQTQKCNDCLNEYETVLSETSGDAVVFDTPVVLGDSIKFNFALKNKILNDYRASKLLGYKPTMSIVYTVGGKNYEFAIDEATILEGAGEVTVSGVNANRFNAEHKVQLKISWTEIDGKYYVKDLASDIFDASATVTPSAADAPTIENGATQEEVNAYNAYKELNDVVASPEAVDSVISNVTSTVDESAANKLTSDAAKVDIKNASIYLQVNMDDDLKTTIGEKGKDGRTVKLIATIGGNDYEVTVSTPETKLYSRLKVTISGLSYDQMYDDVSIKLVFTYTDPANDFESSAITFDFDGAIGGVADLGNENSAASALKNYMAATNA